MRLIREAWSRQGHDMVAIDWLPPGSQRWNARPLDVLHPRLVGHDACLHMPEQHQSHRYKVFEGRTALDHFLQAYQPLDGYAWKEGGELEVVGGVHRVTMFMPTTSRIARTGSPSPYHQMTTRCENDDHDGPRIKNQT
ncbi:unnamed protein product, partial [Aphanomyces euteiches]